MARTRFQSLSSRIRLGNIQGPSGIGTREQGRTLSLLSSELNKMSNFFFKRAEAEAQIQGEKFGAENTPTVQDYQKSIAKGENPLDQFDRKTVFGSSAFNQVAKTLGNSLIVSASNQMNQKRLDVEQNPINIDEFRKRKTLYPIPVEERRGDTIFSLTGLRSITQNAYPHFYEKSSDTFLPIANHASTASTVDVDNESFGDAFAVRCHQNLLKGQFIKPVERTSSGSSTALTWASNNNAFNGDYIETSTFTECTIDGNFTADESATIKFKMPQLTGTADQISIHLVLSGSVQLSSASGVGGGAEIRVQLIDESFGANDVLGYYAFTDNATSTTFNQTLGGTLNTGSAAYFSNGNDSASEYHSSSSGWGEEIKLKVKLVQQSGSLDGNLTGHIRLHDIVIQVDSILDYSDQDKKANAYKIIDDIDTLYCGANGLKDVNSWGGDALITKGVFAYRDLLQRFVNFTDGRNVPYDSSFHPDNWSSGTNISTVKDWAIRYWITEPKPLTGNTEKFRIYWKI